MLVSVTIVEPESLTALIPQMLETHPEVIDASVPALIKGRKRT
jgi:hypothetical protein